MLLFILDPLYVLFKIKLSSLTGQIAYWFLNPAFNKLFCISWTFFFNKECWLVLNCAKDVHRKTWLVKCFLSIYFLAHEAFMCHLLEFVRFRVCSQEWILSKERNFDLIYIWQTNGCILQEQMMFQWFRWLMLVLGYVVKKVVKQSWHQILLWGSFASWKDCFLCMDTGIISVLATWFCTTSTGMLFLCWCCSGMHNDFKNTQNIFCW